uniref:Uncharacterized protein n=1 Tax=Timema cristinae TaxID=61476 RepID=A0A7R9CB87_TIMCR|nr:unnamed protein product [Timema cristinae]
MTYTIRPCGVVFRAPDYEPVVPGSIPVWYRTLDILTVTRVVKMLAMVVFVFATLWLPYRGMLVYNSFAMLFSRKRFMDLWFLMFAKTCIYINWYANSGVLATPKDSGDLCLNSVGKLQEKHD